MSALLNSYQLSNKTNTPKSLYVCAKALPFFPFFAELEILKMCLKNISNGRLHSTFRCSSNVFWTQQIKAS